jgi:4-amino-4-deoxychorismate lyase
MAQTEDRRWEPTAAIAPRCHRETAAELSDIGATDELEDTLVDVFVSREREQLGVFERRWFHAPSLHSTRNRVITQTAVCSTTPASCGCAGHDHPSERKNGLMSRSVLAILNQPSLDAPPHDPGAPAFAIADPTIPQLSVLDLAATRGDGIFESISMSHGHPHAVEAHLRRFQHSAAMLDLPTPDLDAWRSAINAAIAELDLVPEAFIKTVLTRGVEGDDRPTGWAYATPSPDYSAARHTGIGVVVLDRGYRHDVERTSPWLLAGAKTLSYAVNRAVLREAARRGADDVVFVSSDGYVLEGPTSTVLFRRGNALYTPGTGLGILEGTTQGAIFGWAEARGMETGFELLTPAQLSEVDAIWLVSSGRQAAPVREIDGVTRGIDPELTAQINAFLLSRTE